MSERIEEAGNTRSEREVLDKRVALLRPNSIDPDMLDEVARKTLGFVNKRDRVISVE